MTQINTGSKYLSLLVYFCVLFFGCKKEKVIETIYPLSYFPVYPGSYWKYAVNDTDTVVSSTSPDWSEVSYREKTGTSELVYAPLLDGQPIFQYNTLCHVTYNADYYYQYTFFSDNVGVELAQCFDGDPHYKDPIKITVVQKIVNADQDTVVLIKEKNRYIPYLTFREYIFDKGLSSEIIIDTLSGDTTYRKILIDYHINR
jgi:hypothetical protein